MTTTLKIARRRLKLDANGLEVLQALEEDVLHEPPLRCIFLDLLGSARPDPDLALAIYHLLANRSPETLLLTRAVTSLNPAETLLFLAADERDCLPSTGFVLPPQLPPEPNSETAEADHSAWQNSKPTAVADWGNASASAVASCNLINDHQHRRIVSELSRYIELEKKERFVAAEELISLGLLGNGFSELFADVEKQLTAPALTEEIPAASAEKHLPTGALNGPTNTRQLLTDFRATIAPDTSLDTAPEEGPDDASLL